MALQSNRWHFVSGPSHIVKMTVGATAVTAGAPVRLSSNLVIPQSAVNQNVCGIAMEDGAVGAEVGVEVGWGVLIEAVNSSGAAIAVGDIVFPHNPSGTNYSVTIDGQTGQPTGACNPVGQCIVGGANGAKVRFLFTPQMAFTAAGALTPGA